MKDKESIRVETWEISKVYDSVEDKELVKLLESAIKYGIMRGREEAKQG